MKALIRGSEVIEEPFPEWVINNMEWLTGNEKDEDGNPIAGDGWTLVENYNRSSDQETGTVSDPVPEQRTIMVDGKEYVLKL